MDDETPWQYKPDGKNVATQEPTPSSGRSAQTRPQAKSSDSLTWTASEYIEHQRGLGWYSALVLLTIALAGGIYVITKDLFAAVSIGVVGIIVGVFVRRKPQQVAYELSDSGLRIGEKSYSYSQFKSFSTIREGVLSSISFLPLKRLMTPISAFYDPKDEKRIVEIIGQHLPYEERKPDTMDAIARRLRL